MTERPSTSTDSHPFGEAQETIIVGLDRSNSAKAALNWAAKYARLTGEHLRAISIAAWPTGLAGAADGGLPLETLLRFPNDEQSQDLKAATQRIFDQVNPETGWELHSRGRARGPDPHPGVSGCAPVSNWHR